jgi:hypothetical protein
MLATKWDCPELARRLKADGVVSAISADTTQRILRSHQLKPWRHHLWLSPDVPRDQYFAQQVGALVDLYTRPLADDEMVVCADEKTNLQPRPRKAPTLPMTLPRFRGVSKLELEADHQRRYNTALNTDHQDRFSPLLRIQRQETLPVETRATRRRNTASLAFSAGLGESLSSH